MSAAIRARDLFFLYRTPRGDVPALRGLTLEVGERESVAVLGPSGAGKTSLLRLCAGFDRPSSGTLAVLGHDVGSLRTRGVADLRSSSIGIVRQHYHRALPAELTAEEIVALPLRLAGSHDRDARGWIEELLRRAGLRKRRRALPHELSGGEQQRVAVCAAVAKRPRLLLADEPTGELDAAASLLLVDLLLELGAETRAAALLVTHDPAVATRTERTIHIRDGRLAGEGAVDPTLVIDEQGWLRIPRRLREEAGVRDRLRAQASWGRIELLAVDPVRTAGTRRAGEPLGDRAAGANVELRAVSRRFGSGSRAREVVRELTAGWPAGALHLLAGPSGSGKTTVLNLVAGLDRPDEGAVLVGGDRIHELPAGDVAAWRRRVLGYVSQHSTLVDFLSARENVELALSLRGRDDDEARAAAEQWLDWVGLGALAERRAAELSGGEQRRVALARALAPAPRLLVADEPTAHLDRLTGRLVIKLLQRLAHERGTTVLAASHDRDLVAAADSRLELAAAAAPEGEREAEAGDRPSPTG